MGKGLKMNQAFVRPWGGTYPISKIITDDGKIRPEVKSGLFCESCQVPLEGVGGYWRRKDDRELKTWVSPFYRLRKEENHAEDCKYLLKNQITILVGQAQAIENSPSPFEQKPNGLYHFRLNIPDQQLRDLTRQAQQGNERTHHRERVERIWSGQALKSYCYSASGLARIWKMLDSTEDRQELARRVKIAHQDRETPWQEFFFDQNRYDSLANFLKSKKETYPVAVLVSVRQIGRAKNGRYYIKCVPGIANRAKKPTRIAPTVFLSEHLTKSFCVDRHYIIFGDWWYPKKQPEQPWKPNPNDELEIHYRNLTINIYQRAQFCEVEICSHD